MRRYMYMLRNPEALASHFGAIDRRGTEYIWSFSRLPIGSPRPNVKRGEAVPIVRQVAAERELVTVKWGLLPHWAKFTGRAQASARAETISEKPMFADAFQKRRCLIPADGYIQLGLNDGRPYVFEFPDHRLFAFAGVWDSGMNVESAAIITLDASEKPRLRDRIPLVLSPDCYAAWLDPGTDAEKLLLLLQPAVQGIVAVRAESKEFSSDGAPDVDQSTKSVWLYYETNAQRSLCRDAGRQC